MDTLVLTPLQNHDREQFICDNQAAFLYGATEEFGVQNTHFEEDGQIIARHTIEQSLDAATAKAYRIVFNNEIAGGVVLQLFGEHGDLDLLFVSPNQHSQGIGYRAWCAIEKMHPEIKIWQTHTPYFEQRNIHFYINWLGFHIVEFFNPYHPDKKHNNATEGFFRFEKIMK